MKIVINECYGGFGVDKSFFDYYNREEDYNISRTDPQLIKYIEKFGSEMASGFCANLVINEIPSGTLYKIMEYDGLEWIETTNSEGWTIAE